MAQKYYSNGKLLLTGEYAILDGAEALAIPTRYGQSLLIESFDEPMIVWESLDENGELWFEANFSLEEISSPLKEEDCKGISNSLSNSNTILLILKQAKRLNPEFLTTSTGYKITTKLDFPRDWGLGSSSTLINNIANWAHVDAFKLLAETFKGSGYDIAAAQFDNPILYSFSKGESFTKELKISWNFTDKLFFIHLNKKQNSREGIERYYSKSKNNRELISEISLLTTKLIQSTSLKEFESLIEEHERIISGIVELNPIKKLFFPDYNGSIKSLGAWGGDFILVTGDKMDMEYFRKKGFETIIPFNEMIK